MTLPKKTPGGPTIIATYNTCTITHEVVQISVNPGFRARYQDGVQTEIADTVVSGSLFYCHTVPQTVRGSSRCGLSQQGIELSISQ